MVIQFYQHGTLDSGLVTKTVNFEVISETNKTISNVNTEIVDDKDSSVTHLDRKIYFK